eukprot:15497-Heterococcus_DN1.PRE.4
MLQSSCQGNIECRLSAQLHMHTCTAAFAEARAGYRQPIRVQACLQKKKRIAPICIVMCTIEGICVRPRSSEAAQHQAAASTLKGVGPVLTVDPFSVLEEVRVLQLLLELNVTSLSTIAMTDTRQRRASGSVASFQSAEESTSSRERFYDQQQRQRRHQHTQPHTGRTDDRTGAPNAELRRLEYDVIEGALSDRRACMLYLLCCSRKLVDLHTPHTSSKLTVAVGQTQALLLQRTQSRAYRCHNSAIDVSISVTGARRRDFVQLKSGLQLAHGLLREILIGHLPCRYIRLDCSCTGPVSLFA